MLVIVSHTLTCMIELIFYIENMTNERKLY